MPYWKTIMDSDTEYVWVSPLHNNGEFDYRLVRKLIDLREYVSEEELENAGGNYWEIEIDAVAPFLIDQERKSSIIACYGMEETTTPETLGNALYDYYVIKDYGISATLWHAEGKNRAELIKQSNEERQIIVGLFGFYTDRPANRMGSTGWDFIKGDMLAGLRRWKEEQEAHAEI